MSALPSGDLFFLKRVSRGAKQKRLSDFPKLNWPVEPGEPELRALFEAWDPHLSSQLSALLFPVARAPSQDLLVPGVVALLAQLESPLFANHTDLAFRWCSCALAMREASSAALKLLQLVVSVFERMKALRMLMHDAEVASILPHLMLRSGHPSPRHRDAYKHSIIAASDVIPPSRLCEYLLRGLSLEDTRSLVVCVQEVQRVVEVTGACSLGRRGVRDVGAFLSGSADDDCRRACLSLLCAANESLGGDAAKLEALFDKRTSAATRAALSARLSLPPDRLTDTASSIYSSEDRYATLDSALGSRILSREQGSVDAEDDDSDAPAAPLSVELVSPNVNSYAEVVGALDDAAVSGLFLDISRRMDALVEFDSSAAEGGAARYVDVREDAKTYVLILHANICCTWHADEEAMLGDLQTIAGQANPLCRRLCLCLLHALSPSECFDAGGERVDAALAAAVLAALYALVEKPMFLPRLTVHSMAEVVAVLARGLADDRLRPGRGGADAEPLALVATAMNKILVKLSETASADLVLCALLRTLALCIPELDRSNDSIDAGLMASLPPRSARVLVALAWHVLELELRRVEPFAPPLSVPRLLHALHDLFACLPAVFEDDLPFCVAKTLTARMVSALGPAALVATMQTQGMSTDSFLSRLIRRIGGLDMIAVPRMSLVDFSASAGEASEETNAQLGAIVGEVTEADDKDPALRKLYLFLRAHPGVDVHVYFQRVSRVFRTFVLDSLARIEAASLVEEIAAARDKKPLVARFHYVVSHNPDIDGAALLEQLPAELRRFVADELALHQTRVPSSLLRSESRDSTDSVALKLLDGIRRRESIVPSVSDLTSKRLALKSSSSFRRRSSVTSAEGTSDLDAKLAKLKAARS